MVRCLAGARLDQHTLTFHKKGKDGTGKCDAVFTNCKSDVVFGVVFEITTAEKIELDGYEGLKTGYEQKSVLVFTHDGQALEAVTYYATDIDPAVKPYTWYKEHVLRGAREHSLPPDYICTISAIEAISDPSNARNEKELSIYC